MPNGKQGDHPLTDMLIHGKHPFPAEIEELLREVLAIDPQFPDGKRAYVEQVQWDRQFWEWQNGNGIEAGVSALRSVLSELHGESDA